MDETEELHGAMSPVTATDNKHLQNRSRLSCFINCMCHIATNKKLHDTGENVKERSSCGLFYGTAVYVWTQGSQRCST
jgi:hypothetical protein